MEADLTIAFLNRLGLMGWPLAAASVVALALISERVAFFVWFRPRLVLVQKRLQTHLERGHTQAARASLESVASPLARLAEAWLAPVADNEQKRAASAQQCFRGWLSRARGPVRTLGMIAQVAPLMGLTGTVLGLVDTFKVIQASGQTVDPALLAGGIWEALLTTIAGMLISIPAIICIRLFNSRIELTSRQADDLFVWLQLQLPAPEAVSAAQPVEKVG